MALIIFFLSFFLFIPGIGALAGGALIFSSIGQSVLLIIGALIGGASAR
jgi:hypothetical protein